MRELRRIEVDVPVDDRRTTAGCLRRFATRLNELAAPRQRGLDVAQLFTNPTVTERTPASLFRDLRVAALAGGPGLLNEAPPRHLEVVPDYLGFQPFGRDITLSIPARLASAYAERGSVPISVTPRDPAALQNLDVRAIGARLAWDGPLRAYPSPSPRATRRRGDGPLPIERT